MSNRSTAATIWVEPLSWSAPDAPPETGSQHPRFTRLEFSSVVYQGWRSIQTQQLQVRGCTEGGCLLTLAYRGYFEDQTMTAVTGIPEVAQTSKVPRLGAATVPRQPRRLSYAQGDISFTSLKCSH
jgi:hypothetical protein